VPAYLFIKTKIHDADQYAKYVAEVRDLAATALAAVFWEQPPLATETFDDQSEFVLIESASLARLDPDPEPGG
jgi:hypothetical protein